MERSAKRGKLCVQKYHKAAEAACDPTLRQMLHKLEQAEQNHCDTVAQMMDGKVPAQAAKAQNSRLPSEKKQLKANTTRAQKTERRLFAERFAGHGKYVSGVYNTAVFEFNDPAARQVLERASATGAMPRERTGSLYAGQRHELLTGF